MHRWIQLAVAAVAALRVALGVVAVARPDVAARPWVGPTHDATAATVLGRAAGARDIALGAGALASIAGADERAVRDWVAAGAFCDLLDVVATVVAWRKLPRTRALVAAAAGGAAAIGAVGVAAGARRPHAPV
jgi:hypothetical protein